MNAHGSNGMYASGTPRVTAGPRAWASTDTGRDKPVPYEPLRHSTVGATLVVARPRAPGFVEPGRDKPVPYEPLRHPTLGATLVVARPRAPGFAEPGRDKPVPYGLLRHLTVGATARPGGRVVVARPGRNVNPCQMGQALPQAPVRP